MIKMTLQPIFSYKILLKSLFSESNNKERILLKSGRIAFSYIISNILNKGPINNIILPNLICDEMIAVTKKYKIKTLYYNIDNKLDYDMHEIEHLAQKDSNIIVFVNYFGFKTYHTNTKIFKDNYIIEDNAHVLGDFSKKFSSNYADYSFSSLRKLIPVLSGSEIYSKHNDLKSQKSFRYPDFGEIKYSLRGLKKSRRGTSNMGHSLYDDDDFNLSFVDFISKTIIQKYHFLHNDICSRRRSNFKFWENYLSDKNVNFMKSIDTDSDICPYAFPCYVNSIKDQQKWIKWGLTKNITIISWPKYHQDTIKHIPNNFLSKILLFPVNHQFDLNKIIS